MNASILPSMKRSIGPVDKLVTHLISLLGSSPTNEAIIFSNRSSPLPKAPTVLPFRSAMLRMSSFPSTSKHPECNPARMVMRHAGLH